MKCIETASKRFRISMLVVIVGIVFSFGHDLAAQKKQTKPEQPELPKLTIYYLKYADARSVASTLSELAPGMSKSTRIVAEHRINALLVTAQKKDLESINELIKVLDGPETVDGRREFRVFRLRQALAEETVEILRTLLGLNSGINLSADLRTNSVLIEGSTESIKVAEQLLTQIDVAKDPEAIKVFQLQNLTPDRQLQDLITKICGNQAKFSVDSRTNSVIVQGKPDTLATIEALLVRLDERPIAVASPKSYQVRVLWFLSGKNDGRALPAGLENVEKELKKLGMETPWMATQMMVNTSDDFEASGIATLESRCSLRITGHLRSDTAGSARSANRQVEVQISINANDDRTNNALCQLQTTIKAPLESFVILGMVPVESQGDGRQSAFVVQILAPTTPKVRSR